MGLHNNGHISNVQQPQAAAMLSVLHQKQYTRTL